MLWASCEKASNFGRRKEWGTCLSSLKAPDVVAFVVVVAFPSVGIVSDFVSRPATFVLT